MRIDEKVYKAMPAHLQALFASEPNPGRDEVLAAFPANAGAHSGVKGTEASAASTGAVTNARARVASDVHGDAGSASRFFYCSKTSTRDRHEGLEHPGPQFKQGSTLRDAENLGADRRGNKHATVKPTALMRYLVRLVTPPGGTVVDPFMGSGSTGKGAVLEGFDFIGFELDPDDEGHVEVAAARIAAAQAKSDTSAPPAAPAPSAAPCRSAPTPPPPKKAPAPAPQLALFAA